MNYISLAFSESEENIKTTRKYAKSKELSLQKVKNRDLWNVKELQTGRFILEAGKLEDAYDAINRYEY